MKTDAARLIEFLNAIEPLKSVTRHSWCSTGRRESVPEHAWRMAVMAVLVEAEFPDIDMKKVLEMCLFHDLGEINGDIPAFDKREADDRNESDQFKKLARILPSHIGEKIVSLHKEFDACETSEAKLANALDKLEAVMQHNAADLSTWTDVEYSLNLTYGQDHTDYHPFLKILRQRVKQATLEKIQGKTAP